MEATAFEIPKLAEASEYRPVAVVAGNVGAAERLGDTVIGESA